MTVPRAAVRVGRVRQARERALEVEKKDAMPFRIKAVIGKNRQSVDSNKTGFPDNDTYTYI